MLEYAKIIHEAIGIQNPKVFIAVFALVGLLLFGTVGWLVDKGYRVRLRQEPEVHASHATAAEPQKPVAPESRNATTTGKQSPAVTGNGNSVVINNSSQPEQRKPKPPK
jgi:hypothetical protein